ncbi:DUF1385 domain-containing protein, partial [Candidatus Dependentiae bacterium]|nr:DUF1385 domain-containing protein [Candidatus Dependentiae bacterium]
MAVLEGVMMRMPGKYTVSVRKSDGTITTKKENIKSLADKSKFFSFPFIRGVIILFETLLVGFKALNFASEVLLEEEGEEMSKTNTVFSIIFAILLAFGLFFALPLLLTNIVKGHFALLENNRIIFNLIDGFFRILIFLLYLIFISFIKDMKRVFEYHGAEHKAIFAYENDGNLIPENALKYSRLHPRCGTSFIMIVIVLSILVFSVFKSTSSFLFLIGMRFLLIPIIMGVSYEIIKFSSLRPNNFFLKIFTYPGIALQYFTTREPTKDQVEVAV